MSERPGEWLAAATVAAWAGAWLARPVPPPVLAVVVLAAIVLRRPVLVVIALLVMTSALGDRAHDGLLPPDDGPFEGMVVLLTDPEPTPDGRLRFEVRTDGRRFLAEVRSPTAAGQLEELLSGERARVRGATRAFVRPMDWATGRHLVGRLRIESVSAVGRGAPHAAAANRFRRLLDDGAASLPAGHRALLAGLVLGDDRAQPPELTADFRAAGLTHLLAVSGQNLVFVLAVAAPVLRRLRLWPRCFASVAAVAAFAFVTRFEPSVVRAAVVATVAIVATTTGRPSGGLRHLAIAVCLLLAVDPLLVHSLGFRLSVAASVGVLTAAPAIIGLLPGPRWFRDGLGVTAGAQLTVAPVLVPAIGAMPLAALPANVAAGPIAGVLMVWGLVAGAAAGLVGGPIAWLLHRPSAAGLVALERVAALAATLPLGHVDLRHIAVLVGAALVAFYVPLPMARLGAGLVVAAVVLAPLRTVPVPGPEPAGWGATVWVDGGVAVVEVRAGASPVEVLDALRRRRVAAVGLVVVRSSQTSTLGVVDAVASRFPVGGIIGPPGLDHADVVVPFPGMRTRVHRLRVVVDELGPPMRVRIGWTPAVGSAGALGPGPPPVRRHRSRPRDGHPQPDPGQLLRRRQLLGLRRVPGQGRPAGRPRG